jgi:hypothetical protein
MVSQLKEQLDQSASESQISKFQISDGLVFQETIPTGLMPVGDSVSTTKIQIFLGARGEAVRRDECRYGSKTKNLHRYKAGGIALGNN